MDKELEEISNSIQITYQQLKKIETFLNGINIGMAVLLVIMVIILIRIVI